MKEKSMRRKFVVLVAGVAAVAALTTTALAVVPGETPFPSATITTLFVSTNTVTAPGGTAGADIATNFFARGSTVVFKVFAGDAKSGKVLVGDDVKYAYIKVPNQPNVKLTYVAPTATNGPNFVGRWVIPADYPKGLVNFVTRFRSTDKKYGNFVQIPVATSQLTVR
jgi:hypothetical protein